MRRDRISEASIVTPDAQITHLDAGARRDTGKTTSLVVQTGEAGTYVVDVTTKPLEIDLKAHVGIPGTLAQRRKDKELGIDVRARYSKHVRAVFQVGDTRTDRDGIARLRLTGTGKWCVKMIYMDLCYRAVGGL